MNTRTPLIASALLAASLSGAAHATLQGRDLDGNTATAEAYYDTDLNITWLADTNYAKTSGYTDYYMNWYDAMTWASNLSFTDGVNVYDNWRLPTTLQPDPNCSDQYGGDSYGFRCTGSEMGHLFYSELGGRTTSADPDLAKFTNLLDYFYWSGSEYAANPDIAWYFVAYDGAQGAFEKYNQLFAWPVSPGDVGIAAVPEPETYAMILAGLGLVGAMARRRKLAKV